MKIFLYFIVILVSLNVNGAGFNKQDILGKWELLGVASTPDKAISSFGGSPIRIDIYLDKDSPISSSVSYFDRSILKNSLNEIKSVPDWRGIYKSGKKFQNNGQLKLEQVGKWSFRNGAIILTSIGWGNTGGITKLEKVRLNGDILIVKTKPNSYLYYKKLESGEKYQKFNPYEKNNADNIKHDVDIVGFKLGMTPKSIKNILDKRKGYEIIDSKIYADYFDDKRYLEYLNARIEDDSSIEEIKFYFTKPPLKNLLVAIRRNVSFKLGGNAKLPPYGKTMKDVLEKKYGQPKRVYTDSKMGRTNDGATLTHHYYYTKKRGCYDKKYSSGFSERNGCPIVLDIFVTTTGKRHGTFPEITKSFGLMLTNNPEAVKNSLKISQIKKNRKNQAEKKLKERIIQRELDKGKSSFDI